jgi:hypothetical protein
MYTGGSNGCAVLARVAIHTWMPESRADSNTIVS